MDKGNLGSPSGQSSGSGGNIQRHITGADIEKAVAADSIQQKIVNKNKKFKFSFTWLWGGLLIAETVGILLFAVGAVLGYVGVVVKKPAQKAIAVVSVCDTDDVTKAMEKLSKLSREGMTEENSHILGSVAEVVGRVRKLDGYGRDANCAQLIASYAYYSGDINLAKESMSDLNAIRKKGGFISNGVAAPITIELLQFMLEGSQQ